METTMSSLAADGKAKRRAWIKGAAAMLLGLGIVGFFFLRRCCLYSAIWAIR